MFTVVPRSWNPPPKSQCIHKPCFTYCSSAIGSFLVLLLGQVEGFICPPDVTIQLRKKNMVIIEVFLIKLQFYCICFFLSFFFVNKALQWLTKCKLHVLKFWNVNLLYFAVYYTHKHRVQETSCNPCHSHRLLEEITHILWEFKQMSVQTGWPSTGWRGWKAWMAWKSQSENKHLHLSRHPMTGEGWAGWCGWQAREEGVTGQGVLEGEKLEGEEVDMVGQEVGGVAVEGVPVRAAMEVALGWWQQVSLRLWFGVVQCLQVLPCSSLAAPDKVWGVWVCRCHCGRSWCTPKHASLWPSSAWRKHNTK